MVKFLRFPFFPYVFVAANLIGSVNCRLRSNLAEKKGKGENDSLETHVLSSIQEDGQSSAPKRPAKMTKADRKSGKVHVDSPVISELASLSRFEDISNPIIDTSANDEDDQTVTVNLGFEKVTNGDGEIIKKEDIIISVAADLVSMSDDLTLDDAIRDIGKGTISIPKSLIPVLESMDQIRYVELDGFLHEDGLYAPGETIAKSIANANSKTHQDFPYPRASTHGCSDPNAFRFAVVDGGMDIGHWDFDYCGINPVTGFPIDGQQVRCMGKQFLPYGYAEKGQDWYNSKRSHGCHVTGLAAASGLNGKGVAGAMPDEDFCLMVVRIFSDEGAATISKLKEGILWAVDNGAKVINMSLGTSSNSDTLREAIDYARDRGVLLVASAGNTNSDRPNFPASYDDVVGVAAVDSRNNKAFFSNHGTYVDIAALGENVISTESRIDQTPETTIEIEGLYDTTKLDGYLMINSNYVGIYGVEGVLVDCGSGDSFCPGKGSHICLIAKSTKTSFYSQAQNCVKSKGVGAIIYNDNDELLLGTLGVDSSSNPKTVPIPVVGVRQTIGWQLKHIFKNSEVEIYNLLESESEKSTYVGYTRKSGTSMSSPLVAGTAAYLWRECPACDSEDVVNCLFDTALKKDNPLYYGHGILQSDLAFHCLVEMPCCSSVSPHSTQSKIKQAKIEESSVHDP